VASRRPGHGVFVEVSPHPVLTARSRRSSTRRAWNTRRGGHVACESGRSAAPVHPRRSHRRGCTPLGVPVDWAAGVRRAPAASRRTPHVTPSNASRFWLEAATATIPRGRRRDRTPPSGSWLRDGDPDGLSTALGGGVARRVGRVLPALSSWWDRRRSGADAGRLGVTASSGVPWTARRRAGPTGPGSCSSPRRTPPPSRGGTS